MVLAILNSILFMIALVINSLSVFPNTILFDQTIRQAAEKRAILFLPAGYVFTIWAFIYLGLFVFVVYQVRNTPGAQKVRQQIGVWFAVSCVLNIAWLAFFLSDLVFVSTIFIFLFLATLILIYARLGVGLVQTTRAERWFVHAPFGVYMSWIAVSAVANVTILAYSGGNTTNFLGVGADTWTVVVMLVAVGLAMAMLFLRGDVAFALVVVWALVGINARSFDTLTYAAVLPASMSINTMKTTALLLAGAVGGVVLITWIVQLWLPKQAAIATQETI
jgi:translocator protein